MSFLRRIQDNPEKVRNFGLSVIVLGLVILIAAIHFVWWPWMTSIAKTSYKEGENWNDYRLSTTIQDNLNSIWVNHARALLALEKQHLVNPDSTVDLAPLMALPGVKDAFYLNLPNRSGFQLKGLVPLDSLLQKLDVRAKKSTGGRSFFGRILIGGMTKFNRVMGDSGSFPVLVRYIGTYYSNRATEVIGAVLDEDWYIQQIPARCDSLARDNLTLAFMSPYAPDTLDPNIDPYACPNGDWKQTLGVVHGKDTLWWYGDRTAVSTSFGKQPIHYDDDFDIGIYSITQFLIYPKKITDRIKLFTWIAWIAEANVLLLISLLFYGYYFSRKQSRLNRIALGHLSHSVKTPVARLQLAADLLEGSQFSSPEEERKVISTVSGECRQLRRAVENAAHSLEGGKVVIHKEPDELTALIRETALAWQTSFDQAGVRLVVEGLEKPMPAAFDRDKLRLALDNLIDNALRHTMQNLKNLPQGAAVVTIGLQTDDKRIAVSVADFGTGIPASERGNLFKRFGRSGQDPLTGVSGLGLGLSIVKEIVDGHSGKIRVEDAPGGGAKFIVELG